MGSSVAMSVSQAKLKPPQSQSSLSLSLWVTCPSKWKRRQSTSKALVASAVATSDSEERLKSTSASAWSKKENLSFPSEIDGKLLLGGSHNIIFRPQFASFHLLNYGFYAPLSDLDHLTPKLRALLPPPPPPPPSSPSPDHDVPPHLLHQFHAFTLSQLRDHPSLLHTFNSHSRLTFRLHLLPWQPHNNNVLRSYALYARNFTARLHSCLSSHLTDPLLRSFASLFQEPNLPTAIIEISKEQGYLLRMSIDGKEVAQTQSQVVWNLMWDLLWNSLPYNAKQGIRAKLTSRVKTI